MAAEIAGMANVATLIPAASMRPRRMAAEIPRRPGRDGRAPTWLQ